MAIAREANDEQSALWNGLAGRAWVATQELLDRMLKPFEDLLVEAVADSAADALLDVGCGTGSTTLAAARRLGTKARCVGVDISDPMIAVARDRAKREGSPASFIRADAQVHEFEPAAFDMIVSRFGVMFFDDPVWAFANLRRAARPRRRTQVRRLAQCCGESVHDGRRACRRTAAAGGRRPPARRAGAVCFRGPRPHLGDPARQRMGGTRHPADRCGLHPAREMTWLGPVGLILQKADEVTRTKVIDTVRAAVDPHVHGTEVRFTAACWMVGARAPSC